jgi:carbamoyl-phosphate synthase large subunit
MFVAKKLEDLGFKIMATSGTADALRSSDIDVTTLPKLTEGRPNVIDLIKDNKISLIINTPSGKATKEDELKIRSNAILYNVPLITTVSGAQASVSGIENIIKRGTMSVKSLQEYHSKSKR